MPGDTEAAREALHESGFADAEVAMQRQRHIHGQHPASDAASSRVSSAEAVVTPCRSFSRIAVMRAIGRVFPSSLASRFPAVAAVYDRRGLAASTSAVIDRRYRNGRRP